MTESTAPTLSVVIPVYNEREWIRRSAKAAAGALTASRWSSPELVIVDDGSTDGTGEVIDSLLMDVPIRAVHQANAGRVAARTRGIEEATGEYVLLVDSRVLVEEGLDGLVDEVSRGRTVWNAHCFVASERSGPSALLAWFWDALPRIFWSAYFSHPRLVSFGIEEFHRYPKGTGGFLAPRELLRDAFASFRSSFEDVRLANDDTAVLEHIAKRTRIWLSPQFTVRYFARHSLRRFIPHAFHRGLHFVDGFLRRGNPYAPVIVIFYAVTAVMPLVVFRRRAVLPAAFGVVGIGAAAAGASRRLPSKHLVSLAMVSPLFISAYGLGLWWGLWLRIKSAPR